MHQEMWARGLLSLGRIGPGDACPVGGQMHGYPFSEVHAVRLKSFSPSPAWSWDSMHWDGACSWDPASGCWAWQDSQVAPGWCWWCIAALWLMWLWKCCLGYCFALFCHCLLSSWYDVSEKACDRGCLALEQWL